VTQAETNDRRWRVIDHFIVPLMVAGLTALGTWLTVTGNTESSLQSDIFERVNILEVRLDNQRAAHSKQILEMQSLYNGKIESLQSQLTSVQSQLFLKEADNAKLRIALDGQLNTEEVFLAAFNGIQHPIWMKKVIKLDKPDDRGNEYAFQPLLINDAYSTAYNVPRYTDIGASDWAVWPDAVAQNFYDNDLSVVLSGRLLQTVETYPADSSQPNGLQITRRVDKALIELPRGEGLAVLGIAYEIGVAPIATMSVIN